MDNFDRMMSETLSQEDQKLIEELRQEPGFFEQAFGMFRGSTGWVSWLIMITHGGMFLAAAWMTFQFFDATDSVAQLRWGLPTVVLFITGAVMKTSLGPIMQTNRLVGEIHRLELLLLQRDQTK